MYFEDRRIIMRVRIKELAEKQGITLTRIARKCDVSLRAVQFWNKGRSLPSLENAIVLKKILKCNEPNELYQF